MHNALTSTPASSTVEAWGWVPVQGNLTQARMFVEFKSNKIYEYVVPTTTVAGMEAASSKGTYINQVKQSYNGTLVTADVVDAAFASSPAQKGAKKKTPKRQPRLSKREQVIFTHFL